MASHRIKSIVVSVMVFISVLFVAFCAIAADAVTGATVSTDLFFKVIAGFLAFLNTIGWAFFGWLVANDRELFRRVSTLEGNDKTRDALCKERHHG